MRRGVHVLELPVALAAVQMTCDECVGVMYDATMDRIVQRHHDVAERADVVVVVVSSFAPQPIWRPPNCRPATRDCSRAPACLRRG